MSFLNEFPLDWSRHELPYLRDLFVGAFSSLSEARYLADRAGIVIGTFPLMEQANMRLIWKALMDEMRRQGKLVRMIELAAREETIYTEAFEKVLAGRPEIPAPQHEPAQGWWKGDDDTPRKAVRIFHERLLKKRSRLIDMRVARKMAELAGSVARLTLGFEKESACGTGFLIHPEYILTNHHNVVNDEFGPLISLDIEFDYEADFAGDKLVRQGKLDQIIMNSENDWAVVPLNDPVDRMPLPLGSRYSISRDDHLVIIQHPQGAYKQFALEPLAIRHIDAEKTRIQYLADTQKGSSGSPVFNIHMEIVALHHAEVLETVTVNGQKEEVWRNQGIHIDQIIRDLTAHDIPFSKTPS